MKLLLLSIIGLVLAGCMISINDSTVFYFTRDTIQTCQRKIVKTACEENMKSREFFYRMENEEGFKKSVLSWKIL